MTRIEKEKQTVSIMVELYCKKAEGNEELCDNCRELIRYAHARLDRCRYGETKTTCKNCSTHCYSPQMREKIRKVMRFSGPRMILYHPILAIQHLIQR